MSEKNVLLEQLDNLPKIKQFDAFPKTESLYHQRSSRGGLLTVFVSIALFFLLLTETSSYFFKEHSYDFIVDTAVGDEMQINIDMTVAMKCHYLTIDVRDAVGDRLHVSDLEFKKDGTTFEIGHAGRLDSLPVTDFLKNSASHAISSAGGLFFHNPAKQKLKEWGTRKFKKTSHLVPDGPACRIYGSMLVKRVTGNLHITTLGHGYWSFEHTDHKLMNLSHVVHEFSFGPYFPNLAQPLESSVEITPAHFAVFQYFVSVVPTIYTDRYGRTLRTNQYSVTDYARVVAHEQGVPGIFVKYDIEPMTMVVKERATSLLQFLVRLAAIVGGVWTCSGFAFRVGNRAAGIAKKIADGGNADMDPYSYAQSYGATSSMRLHGSGAGANGAGLGGGMPSTGIPQMLRTASGKIAGAAGQFTGNSHRKTESVQQKIWQEEGRPW